MDKYYTGEQLGNYHKKGKGKLPLCCGNVERVIPIYGGDPERIIYHSIRTTYYSIYQP